MSTCVVTGGAGFLGSHLCEHLLGAGHRVICIDNLDTGSLQNISHIRDADFVFDNHDITETVRIDEPVDFIYHLASPASPIDYARLPLHTLKVGSYGTHHMLGVAKAKRARFLLASTSEVYGDPEIHPQPESYWGHVNPIGPRGVYDEAKRYAEALTMAYHRQQGLDTAIVRIFNSVLADEQVLYDDGRELRHETAGELSARLANHAIASGYVPHRLPIAAGGAPLPADHATPALEFPLSGYSVPSFGDDATISGAETPAFIGHPTDQKCFEVRTAYGRSIRVTGDHSLFVRGDFGSPEPKPVSEMTVGEKIALGRKVRVPERDRRLVSMIEVCRWAEMDVWKLDAEAPGLGEIVWERRQEALAVLASRPQPASTGTRRSSDWPKLVEMRERDRVPLPLLWRLGIAAPVDGRISAAGSRSSMPMTIDVTDELLWFLGVWVAQGSWAESERKDAFITLSGERHVVARASELVERELGLHAVRAAWKPGRAPAACFHSQMLLRLMRFLGFGPGRKRIPGWILGLPKSRLKWFLEGYREGDGADSGKQLVEGKRHEFSTVDTALKDDLIIAFARFGLFPSVGRYETTDKPRSGDQRYPSWRLTLCDVSPWSPLDWDEGVEQRLNAQTTGDLVWAKIHAIEEVPATPLVFDFSVPGQENFWAGSGVMAHNTYGPRMRAHDGRAIPTFLRQALQDKPLTVFGDGSQTRSFCFVDDLVRGLVALIESDAHLPINIGNPDEYTLRQLAETVVKVTESRSKIVHEALPIDDPQVRQPDITRAREILGWEPTVGLEEGLRRTIELAGIERLVGATD